MDVETLARAHNPVPAAALILILICSPTKAKSSKQSFWPFFQFSMKIKQRNGKGMHNA